MAVKPTDILLFTLLPRFYHRVHMRRTRIELHARSCHPLKYEYYETVKPKRLSNFY